MTSLSYQQCPGRQLPGPELGRFYKRNGHKGRIQPEDECHWLSKDKQILTVARLSSLSNGQLLRGLWVDKLHRGKGYGSQLLQQIQQQVSPLHPLYCLAFTHLEDFYQQHGFIKVTEPGQNPDLQQLLKKQETYAKRGNTTLLMIYTNSIND